MSRSKLSLILHAVRGWWRRLWNRCGICGKKRSPYVLGDLYTVGPHCRACNKTLMMGRMYGMSDQRFRGIRTDVN
jgi:hypothetical protein